ncbi:MAG: TOBE domain-containing protein, partial [Bacilli bacterium]|nr:TOBE domain-containing protein [Bacilli bacterium]
LPEEFKKKPLLPEMVLGVRPEHILDADNGAAKTMSKESAFEVSVELTELLGSEYYLHNDFGGIKFVSKQEANRPINKGDKLKLIFNMDKIHLFNPETEEAIY